MLKYADYMALGGPQCLFFMTHVNPFVPKHKGNVSGFSANCRLNHLKLEFSIETTYAP